jgi:hypothetical protein
MTLHREWFFEYEKYNGGDISLGDESIVRTIEHGKVKFQLKDGIIRTLPGVLHILELARNLKYISKMSDVGVHIVFEKETCKMVQGEIILMRRVWNGTMYNMLGSTRNNGCNSYAVLEGGNEEYQTHTVSGEKTMLWHQRLGLIGERGL